MAGSTKSSHAQAERMAWIAKRVTVALGERFLTSDAEFQDMTIADWVGALDGFDVTEIKAAFAEHIRESAFPVRPAHIVEIMRRERSRRGPSSIAAVDVSARVESAKSWLQAHESVPAWMSDWSATVVPALLDDGFSAARLVAAGFVLPKQKNLEN